MPETFRDCAAYSSLQHHNMRKNSEKIAGLLVLVILVAAASFRISAYGDPRLSIGTSDTSGYISASQAPLFSIEMFTGRRLFTTNLLFKLANSDTTCPRPKISTPGNGQENERALKNCFDRITLIQVALSILGWSALAWIISRRMSNGLFKIFATILIVGFAYSPQIAEWDSVLSPESLSLSGFALLLALAIEIGFGVAEWQVSAAKRKLSLMISGWVCIFFLWVFLRDVHIYAIPLIITLCLPFLRDKGIRAIPVLIPALVILGGLFLLGSITAHISPRWQPSVSHVFDTYIMTSSSAVDFMTTRGMPSPASGAAYQTWFNAHADRAYALFLIEHPGFTATTLIESRDQFSSDFYQPYFPASETQIYQRLALLGEFLHPETNAIFLLDALLFYGVLAAAIKRRDDITRLPWAWFAAWIFLYAGASLFISFFGDTFGTRRHIFPSVELMRLYAWMFIVVLMDQALES